MTDDIMDGLKDDSVEPKAIIKKQPPKSSNKKSGDKKIEDILSSPQERFKQILVDLGYSKGVNVITDVFFRGDTDSPEFLDKVLKLSGVHMKSRELILTSYFGKGIDELGIELEPTSSISKTTSANKLKEIAKKGSEVDDNDYDLSKFADDELKQFIRSEKAKTSLAQLKSLRAEAERSLKENDKSTNQQISTRQVRKPVVGNDGTLAKDGAGNIIYETITEPVYMNNQGNNNQLDIVTLLALLKGDKSEKPSEVAAVLDKFSQKIDSLERNREIDAREQQIKKLEERVEQKEREYKEESSRKEEKFEDKLERLLDNHKNDLDSLKGQFTMALQHRKELDEVIGTMSSIHKKEMDEIKKQLDTTKNSIERTVVSKMTDTGDKLTDKLTDVAKDVVEPLTSIMGDHYKTTIDAQRKELGLPSLRDSIPSVNEKELRNFIDE